MKKYLFIITLILFASCDNLTNCIEGNGSVENFERELTSFDNVTNNLSGDVYLHAGKSSVTITIEDNLEKYILTDISNQTLKLNTDENCINSDFLRFDIYNSQYSVINNNASGDIFSDSLNFDPFIEINGSGNITLAGSSDMQTVEVNGSGDLFLQNMQTVNIEIEGNGSGDVIANVTNNAIVEINGSGDVTIENISGVLDVTINGSGDLYYSGSPSELKVTENGSGRVKKK